MNLSRRILSTLLTVALVLTPAMRVAAEDIDLFVGGTTAADNPNILLVIDNSANWANTSQHWPGIFQGQAELRALRTVLNEVGKGINLGLMMLTAGVGTTDGWQNKNGGFVRYAIRDMDPDPAKFDPIANKSYREGFQELIGDAGCTDGPNSIAVSTRNCIYKNATSTGGGGSLGEGIGTNVDYSATMFEVFKYFGGYTKPDNAQTDIAGAPVDRSHFGPLRYSGNPDPGGDAGRNEDRYDSAAFADPIDLSRSAYNPPISPTNSCGKNYVIFIGNGFPTQDAPSTLLSEVGGSTSQLIMPQFSTTTSTATTVLGTRNVCESENSCVSAAQAAAAASGQTFDSYSCAGGAFGASTNLGIDGVCESVAQCTARAQANFSGYSSYSCTGGTAQGTTTTLQADTGLTCETAAACATRAQSLYPGYLSYACTGGSTSVASTVNLGAVTTTCETANQCATRAETLFPGYSSYSCSAGASSTPTITLESSSTACETVNNCKARAASTYPGYGSYSCDGGTGTGCSGSAKKNQLVTAVLTTCSGQSLVGQQMQGAIPACASPNLAHQAMTGTNACVAGQTMEGTTNCSGQNLYGRTMQGHGSVITVSPTGVTALPGNEARYADEWAKFLYTTDVSVAPGQQNITTYTIDVFKDAQDSRQTALLYSMAKYGGGKYFQATSEQAILDALRQIFIEIQSKNTVFASASLPINATNRSQNENQVFIGMFRPDANARPRWYGNLKRYQIALFSGAAGLADADGAEAVTTTTGFIQPCARSYWSTDSGTYWSFSTPSAGTCTSSGLSVFSDRPDGPQVEKGATAEVVRKGNNPPTTDTTPTWALNRTLNTCRNTSGTITCSSAMVAFDTTNVDQGAVGAASSDEHQKIVDFTRGVDVADDNGINGTTDVRPSVHGDVAHSRPLPVNYAGSIGVVVYYGSNDGTFRAMRASDGKELWAFVAPEHHAKLKRLYDNSPQILYPSSGTPPTPAPTKKDYFFDGSTSLFQNADNSKVWIFTTERRGGRMLYGFDVTAPASPLLKWRVGCDDTGCTSGMSNIGQTWSLPNVARIKGFDPDSDPATDDPVVVIGGGYDSCEDQDTAAPICASPTGSSVFVLNANTGAVLRELSTLRSVPSDVTLIDRDFDGYVDHGYVSDTGGNLYRIDFVNPSTLARLAPSDWKISRIAYTNGAGRKFLFPPGALAAANQVYLAFASGDRERPLITNYPYLTYDTVTLSNRAYMFIDRFVDLTLPGNLPVDLDNPSGMENFTTSTTCGTQLGANMNGWFFDLNSGRGEQGVTSTTIFGGLIFFSTNYPDTSPSASCGGNLGKARGYAVNLLNASGAVGVAATCGGDRSGLFIGGGLPPSPVTGVVPVDGKMVTVMIGGVDRTNPDVGSVPIGAQRVKPNITQKRKRVYWYRGGDK